VEAFGIQVSAGKKKSKESEQVVKKMCVELQETAFLPRKLESWIVKTACTNFTRQTDTILLTCVGTHVRYVGF